MADIDLYVDDYLELSYSKEKTDSTNINISSSSLYKEYEIQEKSYIFDPQEEGQYTIEYNNNTISINVYSIPDSAIWRVSSKSLDYNNNVNISEWKAKIGNNISVSNSSNEPLYKIDNTITPTVESNGIDEHLIGSDNGFPIGDSSRSFIAVHYINGTSNKKTIMKYGDVGGGGANPNRFELNVSGNDCMVEYNGGGNQTIVQNAYDTGQKYITSVVLPDSSKSPHIYINGVSKNIDTTSSSLPDTKLNELNVFFLNGYDRHYNGGISELILYNTELSGKIRENEEQRLADSYNINLN